MRDKKKKLYNRENAAVEHLNGCIAIYPLLQDRSF
jgi:hypothetical protein